MSEMPGDILDCAGNTTLLALRHVTPRNGASILLKMAIENPTGSMKDRMALAMIEAAEADGRLKSGGCVVEYTGGSTGVSLALVCAVKRYPLHIVSSEAFAQEKLDQMKILGANLDRDRAQRQRGHDGETHAGHGGSGPRDCGKDGSVLDGSVEKYRPAGGLSQNGGGNLDADGWADRWLVQSVGTAASLRGLGEALRQRKATIRMVAVEPAESAVLSGDPAGSHKIDGVGAGFVVPLWEKNTADQIEQVSTEEATAMALRLGREEGLFAGTSTGANVIAALRLAEQLGQGATVVTIQCDTGMKYLKSYRNELRKEEERLQDVGAR